MKLQIIEPDYWKCRGRYSKQACRKNETDTSPITADERQPVAAESSSEA